ncbi:MAG: S8 family serine peptidase [Acidobacteriaceae bacterium]|nr:S8 family serine peptidase [Acidobacteriaceae bacterium]
MHHCIEQVWPIDTEAAFGALPTPLRMHADPRFTGKGVTIAHIDAGFYPHPDLIEPRNRIRAWVDTAKQPMSYLQFDRDQRPQWPGCDRHTHWIWHGLMTTSAAFGNGWLSSGLYRGLASDSELVLVQTWDKNGRITNATLTRALRWIRRQRKRFNIQVVSISVAGDPVVPLRGNSVDAAVKALAEDGVIVIAAAGNRCAQQLVPPATACEAITVGGLDDRNGFDRARHEVWHSNYDVTEQGAWKPEVVAPSLWVVAPMLPGSDVAVEAEQLFKRRAGGDRTADARINELKLVNRYYQHVEGTSFAAPIIASIVACMLEARPGLKPQRVKDILMAAAYKIPGAPDERQGAGAVDAGNALEIALSDPA